METNRYSSVLFASLVLGILNSIFSFSPHHSAINLARHSVNQNALYYSLHAQPSSKKKIIASISSTSDSSTTFSSYQKQTDSLNSMKLPSLVVFDLDNTLWEPELFKLRELERAKIQPIADKDVTLFPAVKSIISSIRSSPEKWSNTKFAVASRGNKIEWAKNLLTQFGLDSFFSYVEIFPKDKKTHFQNLKRQSGIPFSEMLFFDDNRDGKFGNCVPVSQMGVLSVHCPEGINGEEVWTNGLSKYNEWSEHKTPNTIVEWDGSMTVASQPERFKGVVKMVNTQKRFGFINYGNRNTRDMFFHFSNLPGTHSEVEVGDELGFTVVQDKGSGKDAAVDIEVLSSLSSAPSANTDTVNMRVFSMNLPFAALLANQYKTLETRNGTMFVPYPEGTKMLLHVGQRIYPDENRHMDVMRSGGLSDEDITDLKSLPKGFGKGMVVAIVEIGKTVETTLEERCDPDFQRKVAAFGADSGMRATEIKRVAYLKRGVRVSGKGGIFKCDIEKSVIPDGWL